MTGMVLALVTFIWKNLSLVLFYVSCGKSDDVNQITNSTEYETKLLKSNEDYRIGYGNAGNLKTETIEITYK